MFARRFEDLEVWKAARLICAEIYSATRCGGFRTDQKLRDQMRSASVSILSNIAEGFESRTAALFRDYLGRSKASAGELRAQLYVAFDQKYIDQALFEMLLDRVQHCSSQLQRLKAAIQVHKT